VCPIPGRDHPVMIWPKLHAVRITGTVRVGRNSRTSTTVFEVDRGKPFERSRLVREQLPDPGEGEVLLSVDNFGLSTNNLAYVLLGDVLGHWNAFPAAHGWGRPPTWGTARVLAADPAVASVGQALSGYLPMATHVMLRAERTASGILSTDDHRSEMLPIYRRMTRLEPDPYSESTYSDIDTVLLPVVPFAAVLSADLLADGVGHVLVSSASSRSGAGLARLLLNAGIETTGLTSGRHIDATHIMGAYTSVHHYNEIADLKPQPVPTTFVDIAGSAHISAAVHHAFGNRLASSIAVGGTHLRELPDQPSDQLPGPTVQRFSVGEREQEMAASLGLEAAVNLERDARSALVPWAAKWLHVSNQKGLDTVHDLWRRVATDMVDPLKATIVSP